MDTYEYPLGVTFKASTPEHAAARVFGGTPGDYLAVESTDFYGRPFIVAYRYKDVLPEQTIGRSIEYIGDIPIVREA